MSKFHFHVALRDDLFEDQDGGDYVDVELAKAYGRRLALNLRSTGAFTGGTVLVVDVFEGVVGRFPVDSVVELPRGRHARDSGSDTRKAEPVGAEVPPGGE